MFDLSMTESAIGRSFSIVRTQGLDEIGHPNQGYLAFQSLLQRIKEQNPKTRYPDNIGSPHSVIYTAYNDSLPVGVITGSDKSKLFSCHFLVVDPAFSGHGIGQSLMNSVKHDYREITVTASAFGERADLTDEEKFARKRRLVDYYKKMGFKPNDTVDLNTDFPVHMTWKK